MQTDRSETRTPSIRGILSAQDSNERDAIGKLKPKALEAEGSLLGTAADLMAGAARKVNKLRSVVVASQLVSQTVFQDNSPLGPVHMTQ